MLKQNACLKYFDHKTTLPWICILWLWDLLGKLESEIFDADKISEDMGIHIFDVENDGDQDIYIASGGNEFSPDS